MSRIADQVTELAQPIAAQHGVELWGVDFVKEGANWVLRVTIDSEAGISHAECEAVSRDLDAQLDARDFIPHAYMLEVSSPGAERPLRTPRDFERFRGRKVLVKLYTAHQGKKEWEGELLGAEDGHVRIRTPQHELSFTQDQVSLVRLTVDFQSRPEETVG